MRAGIKYSPAHQNDPRAPQAQLGGGFEAQARGAPGDYYSFTNQAGKKWDEKFYLWGLKCASIYLDLLLHRGPFIKCFSEKYISPPIIHIIKHKHIIPIQIPENLMLLNVLKFWSVSFTGNHTLRYIGHLKFAPSFCFHKLKLNIIDIMITVCLLYNIVPLSPLSYWLLQTHDINILVLNLNPKVIALKMRHKSSDQKFGFDEQARKGLWFLVCW